MAVELNRLTGTNRISDEYGLLNDNAETIEQAFEDAGASVVQVQQNIDDHEADDTRHWTEADRTKMEGIEEGAQPNQNAVASLNGVDADSEETAFFVVGGVGITISTNPLTKTLTVTATGSSTPGEHGSSHTEYGADPIPNATDTEGGLLSAEDKTRLDSALTAPFTWADLEG